MKAKLSTKLMYVWLVALALSIGSLFVATTIGQQTDQVKEQIFKEAKEALQRAKEEGVPLLSPNNFAKAEEFYQKALEDYEQGESLKRIRENIERAMEHMGAAFESAKLSRVALEYLIQMRDETIALEVSKYAADEFTEAERKFRQAAMKVEDGDVKSARSIARDAEKKYRRAMIEGLKKGVLAEASDKLKEVKNSIPKETFRKAKAELDELEDSIEAQKREEFAIGELFAEVHARIQQTLTLAGIVVEASELPDLVIEELALSPEQPHEGKDVEIGAVVGNVGEGPAEGILVLFLTCEKREIGSAAIEYLEPGQVEEVNITTVAQELGECIITARVDPENRIEESNEQNNEALQHYAVEIPFFEEHPVWNMPDLAVTSLFVEPDRANPGETIFLRASVSNSGTGITEPARVVFLVDNIEVGHTDIGPLEPSMQANVRAAWMAEGSGRHRAIAQLELEEDIFDQDSRNNRFEAVVRVSGEEVPVPEIEASLIDIDDLQFAPGESYDISVKFRNPSFADVQNIPVEFYIDGEPVSRGAIEYLSPGEDQELRIPWNNITPGEHMIELRMNLPERLPEAGLQRVKSWHFNVPDQTHLYNTMQKDKWVSLGPRLISKKFQGRLHKIALHPTNPKIMYVSTPRGGIWKTTTGGKKTKGKMTWTPLGDKLGTIFGGAVALDPKNPQIVYYATGFSGDPSGVGIYKSIDGGTNWSLFASKAVAGGVNNLIVRYTKTKEVLIYAGTNRGVLRYKNKDPKAKKSQFKDWEVIKGGQVRDMAVSPTDYSLVYASIKNKGLWRTRKGETAKDNTSDWKRINKGLPDSLELVIDIFKSNPKILYASCRYPKPIGRIDIFFTDNEGDSWKKVLSKKDNDNRNEDVQYNPFIRVHPTKHIIYYGGQRLYKAEKEGKTWKEILVYGTHADMHELKFDPHTTDKYYLLNDGGIWECNFKKGKNDDYNHLNYDLRVTEFYDFDVSQATPDLMIGGTQDNGTILYEGSLDWKIIRVGDGYYSLIGTKEKITNKNKNKLVLYSQHQKLRDTKRSDKGVSTKTPDWKPKGLPKGLPNGYGMRDGWISLHANPSTDKYILSGGDQVYASTDGGMNWYPKGPNPKAKNVKKNSKIRRVIVQPKTYDWFAGNSKGQIFYTSNPIGGWTLLFAHPYDAEVTSLAFAPNHKVLYATFETSVKQAYTRIWRFEMNPPPQEKWSIFNITDNFPVKHKKPGDTDVKINVIAGDGHSDLVAYVGTDKGVFRGKTSCSGCTWNWQPYNDGLPLAIVNDLLVVPKTKELRAATRGRGAWTVMTGL